MERRGVDVCGKLGDLVFDFAELARRGRGIDRCWEGHAGFSRKNTVQVYSLKVI